jgi:transcription factor WhiB
MRLEVISPARMRARSAGPVCAGTPLGLWFGPPDDGLGEPVESPADERARVAVAKSLCARCPVRAGCLAEELAWPVSDQHGVRGGLTAVERRELIGAGAAAVGGWTG